MTVLQAVMAASRLVVRKIVMEHTKETKNWVGNEKSGCMVARDYGVVPARHSSGPLHAGTVGVRECRFIPNRFLKLSTIASR